MEPEKNHGVRPAAPSDRNEPRERLIRVLHDKAQQRFAIHDVETDELLHVWTPPRTVGPQGPRPFSELEAEAIRDFLVNGDHGDEDDDEPGW